MLIEAYELKGGLSKNNIKILHERALHLIENDGIEIPHDGILHILSDIM